MIVDPVLAAGTLGMNVQHGVVGLLLAAALWLSLPRGQRLSRGRRGLAMTLGLVGLGIMWRSIPALDAVSASVAFRAFAVLTILSAAATITTRSPVYSAIWFAASLLGVAALMMLQGAQFLAVATVAVYAGAIVVTFLFVLMLARPEGNAFYDRISWGTAPPIVASVAAVFFVLLVMLGVTEVDTEAIELRAERLSQLNQIVQREAATAEVRALRIQQNADQRVARLEVAVADPDQRALLQPLSNQTAAALRDVLNRSGSARVDEIGLTLSDVRAEHHTAHLGGQLFSRHLIAIQAAGALLMAALVGAIAIAARGGALDSERELA